MWWSAGCDIDDLTGIVFSRLSSLVIDGVAEQDSVIVVRARTASWSGTFPGRGALTGQVPGFHGQTVANVPADSCPVLVRVGCGGFLPWVGCARRRWVRMVRS